MGRSLACEWGKDGIRVNTVSPGYIYSKYVSLLSFLCFARRRLTKRRMTKQFLDTQPGLKDKWSTENPLGRIGETQELRGVYLWLAADGSTFCTGSECVSVLFHLSFYRGSNCRSSQYYSRRWSSGMVKGSELIASPACSLKRFHNKQSSLSRATDTPPLLSRNCEVFLSVRFLFNPSAAACLLRTMSQMGMMRPTCFISSFGRLLSALQICRLRNLKSRWSR